MSRGFPLPKHIFEECVEVCSSGCDFRGMFRIFKGGFQRFRPGSSGCERFRAVSSGCGVVWCGVVWRGVAWRGVAWRGVGCVVCRLW